MPWRDYWQQTNLEWSCYLQSKVKKLYKINSIENLHYVRYAIQQYFAIRPVRDSCLGKYDWPSHWWHWKSPHQSSEICGENKASTTKNIWLVKHLWSIMVCAFRFLRNWSQSLQPEQQEITKNWISPHSNRLLSTDLLLIELLLFGTICPWKSEKKHPLIVLDSQMF